MIKIPREVALLLLQTLDGLAKSVDRYEYGLPIRSHGPVRDKMIESVQQAFQYCQDPKHANDLQVKLLQEALGDVEKDPYRKIKFGEAADKHEESEEHMMLRLLGRPTESQQNTQERNI